MKELLETLIIAIGSYYVINLDIFIECHTWKIFIKTSKSRPEKSW